MKVHTLKCSCGFTLKLTDIQFEDYDCGMMGFVFCPTCKCVVLPTHHAGKKCGGKYNQLQETIECPIAEHTIEEVEGKDPGWK